VSNAFSALPGGAVYGGFAASVAAWSLVGSSLVMANPGIHRTFSQ
jgi:hypothetical protein